MKHDMVLGRVVSRAELVLLALGILTLFALSALVHSAAPFASSEVKFADNSEHGLSIVPASCPSSPHYSGQCDGTGTTTPVIPGRSCTPHTECAGNWVVTIAANCQATASQQCALPYSIGCGSGVCLPPPPPQFLAFQAYNGNGVAFNATGHIQVQPALVRSGSSTRVYWNVGNVSSCTITGTNGDSFSGTSSGESGTVSGPIVSKTTFTLNCVAYPGATPESVTEVSNTVDIAPVFQEL